MGGVRGITDPPELRRRAQGPVRGTAAAAPAEHIRGALRTAQRKLLAARKKLQSNIAGVRSKLASRG